MPFKITNDLTFQTGSTSYPMVRAIAILFQWVKKKVESELEHEVSKVVLTVPFGFGLHQRQLIVDAAKIAGFKVLHLLHETTSAAITYYAANAEDFRKNEQMSKNICVFDFGSGKLDIANYNIKYGRIELINSVTDLHLGGRDFDELLFKDVIKEIEQKYAQIDLKQKHLDIIRQKCIEAKEALSSCTTAKFD